MKPTESSSNKAVFFVSGSAISWGGGDDIGGGIPLEALEFHYVGFQGNYVNLNGSMVCDEQMKGAKQRC